MVHGDDFTVLSAREEIIWVKEEMEKKYTLKLRGILGVEQGDDRELTILNRALRWDHEGVKYEADPRHAELTIEGLGLRNAKEVVTPGVKEGNKSEEGGENDKELAGERATAYRKLTARANYLAQDRMDIQYAVKDLTRGMAKPTEEKWGALKRLVRYLKGRPRVTLQFPCQEKPLSIRVYVDSDFAGCRKT